jgi:hypothetical protein
MVRRAAGTEQYTYEPAVSEAAMYDHPSLGPNQKMRAWLVESFVGAGIDLYTQPVGVSDVGDVTELAEPAYQLFTDCSYVPTLQHRAYNFGGVDQLSDADRLRLAHDVFDTVVAVQQAREIRFFQGPAIAN